VFTHFAGFFVPPQEVAAFLFDRFTLAINYFLADFKRFIHVEIWNM
jgi:hypothetical protein